SSDLRALLAAQAEAGEPVDAIVLNGLRPGRAFLRLATALPSGLQAEVRHGGNAVLPTTVPGDEWFARAGRNLRAALRKARNRAERRDRKSTRLNSSHVKISYAV